MEHHTWRIFLLSYEYLEKRVFLCLFSPGSKLHNRVNDMHSHKIRRGRGTSRLALCMLSNCIRRKLMKRMLTAGKRERERENRRIGEREIPVIDVLLNQAPPNLSLNIYKKENVELFGIIRCQTINVINVYFITLLNMHNMM